MPRKPTGRSEASRARDRARVKAWRKASPHRAAANSKKAGQKWRLKQAGKIKPKSLPTELAIDLEVSIVSERQLRAPRLTYIDARGCLHSEDYRSAEQLIADFLAGRRRRETPPKKEGAPP